MAGAATVTAIRPKILLVEDDENLGRQIVAPQVTLHNVWAPDQHHARRLRRQRLERVWMDDANRHTG